mgnify:CR=1 FL=1
MIRIHVEISDEDNKLIEQALERMCQSEANTHGRLDLPRLAAMLDRFAVIRSVVGSPNGAHDSYICYTGRPKQNEPRGGWPRDWLMWILPMAWCRVARARIRVRAT